MKILIFGDASSIHIIHYIKYFTDMGNCVVPVSFKWANEDESLEVLKLGSKKPKTSGGNFYYLYHIGSLVKIIQREKPDYIQCHYSVSYGFIGAIAKKFANSRAQLSVICHGTDILGKDLGLFKNWINQWTLKRSDKIVSVSDQITDHIASLGINANKILTRQYGVNVIELSKNKCIPFISNRPYVPNSRLEIICAAFRDVQFGDMKPVFVISNLSEQELKKWEYEYPMYSFYPKLTHEEMIEIVSKCRCYISLTESDGTALSLLEAMEAGAIPIVSNIPSNRSWIVDGLNGFLVRTKDQLLMAFFEAMKSDLSSMVLLNRKIIESRAERLQSMESIYNFLMDYV